MAPSVMEAMKPYWLTHFMLPGQGHPHAQAVGEALENAREGVALLAGCEPFEIVFTGGGTEANNLAILGLLASQPAGHVLVTALEHDSVLGAASSLVPKGWEVETIGCDSDGVVDPEVLAAKIRANTKMVCVQLANPVIGTIQPVRDIADLCHNRGVPVHCDATQAFGKMPVDVMTLRADTVSISGHKFYGPKGSGALYVRRGLHLSPIGFGEPREMGLRPGAENVPACIGLGAAASLAARCAGDVEVGIGDLRDYFSNGLISTLGDKVSIVCEDSIRLPNTMAVEMPGDAKRIQRAARQLAIATAQSDSPPDEITRALRAVGKSSAQIGRTIRLSLGWTSSRDQVDRAIELLADAADGIVAA
ncbi:Cysteine desulfurase [Rubripirellula tenax]|uniref:Cysteine desulfurase n=2 Tax=Rubripirellula tenax TaxID=2528015 RepID=A0A5C6FI74_9BACT|nr:Cysteine desulfurase [Rubripirellula tenax]